MIKNDVLRIIALLFALAVIPLAISQTSAPLPGSSATTIPDHITLTWTADPSTTMAITWRTDLTVTSGFVQYQEGEKLSKEARQIKADSRDFATNLGTNRLFSVTLVNLAPNKRYSYRVGDGEHWSKMSFFSTANPRTRAFKFLVFGDSQASPSGNPPYNIWRNTVHNAFNANPDSQFMVSTGDLVDIGQDLNHWNAWFAAAEGVIDQIPLMPATGNHESYGSKETAKPQYWAAQFSLPKNGPEGLKGQAYSYDYGPVHFVVLDSQQEEQKQYGDILKIQQTWLDADLAASKAVWKIVFIHRPPYGAMAKRTNEAVKSAFCPTLEKYHVDLVFNGHDHAVARSHPINNGAIMGKPSQGIIYYLNGQSGGKTYPNLEKMPWHAFFHNPLDQPNYLVVDVASNRITVKMVKQDGTIMDTFSMKK